MKKKALAVNLLVLILEGIGFSWCFREDGWSSFQYYTVLSNFLVIPASIFYCIFGLRMLSGKTDEMPHFVTLLRFVANVGVGVTFIVVLTVLMPAEKSDPLELLFSRSMLYHHLLCPVLSILSFVFLEKQGRISPKEALVPTGLTIVYGVLFGVLNYLRRIDGPYPFLRVHQQSVMTSVFYAVAIPLGTFLLGSLIASLHNRFLQ